MPQESTKKRNPYFALMGIAWKYAKGERKQYLLVYSMFTISNIIDALNPIIWGLFINAIQVQGADVLHSAWLYVGIYLLIMLIDWVFHGIARVKESRLAFNLSRNYLQEMYHKTLQLPVQWHQDNHSGATINRIRKAYEALKSFFETGFRHVHAIGKFVFSFAAMLYFTPLFGGVAILMGIGIIWIIGKFDKPFMKVLNETNEREHKVSASLFDSLSNIVTVITLRLGKRMEAGVMENVDNVYEPYMRKTKINEWKWFSTDYAVGIIYAVILVGYVYQNYVPGEVFLIGTMVTLISYVDRFTSVFHDIAWQYTQIVNHYTHVRTADNIVEAYEKHSRPRSADALPSDWQALKLKQINFLHGEVAEGDEKRQGLFDLSMQIKRGERIALIGESGSGKSTLLALLRGLYEAKPGGEITADDGLKSYELVTIGQEVTLMPQEPEIFENTIEYNITLGLPFPKEEVERVCEAARFQEVITQLPKGLESAIQEKGVNLSGGQKQRLALARGILAARESNIVLLDEPTSSVDPKTELEIYDSLFAAFKDKAVISSLHRLHLLPKFDFIYVMDQGRVVDAGSFEDLYANSEVFQELWKHQEEQTAY